MDKCKIIKRLKKVAILCLLASICAILVVASVFYAPQKSIGTQDVGAYTFNRTMTLADGANVEFYESGDQSYHYYHDKDGFILLRDEDSLNYAIADNGRPKDSGISLTAPQNAINNVKKMTVSDVDLEKNPDLRMDTVYSDGEKNAPLLNANVVAPKTIYNVIIYIMFADEGANVANTLASNPNDDMLNGAVSLKDYYSKASFGNLTVNSITPQDGSLTYVYKDKNNRNYYNVKDGSANRAERERELLGGAVTAAATHFNFSGKDLDSNKDGFVDSVGFLVSNSAVSDWGNLLWPHAWSFDSMRAPEKLLNGIKVNEFSFNFSGALKVGLLAHEFFHVLGAPDLYHYEDKFTPVGRWDLMEEHSSVPQFMTTYMRDTYLKAVGASQIQTITSNGVFSLKPIELAAASDVLAYKIPSERANEYFMVEYRNPKVASVYDTELSGAGLIIYRINTKAVEGNRNALHKNPNAPDELYIFRPHSVGGSEVAASASDVECGYLSPTNRLFNTVGASIAEKPRTYYDYSTIYYADGANSGIKIDAISRNNASIEFKVSLNSSNNIDDAYFDNKITAASTEYTNGEFSGINTAINIGEIDVSYLSNIIVRAVSDNGAVYATNTLNVGKFQQEYANGKRSFASRFVISDKGSILDNIFTTAINTPMAVPTKITLSVIDADNTGEKELITQNIATNGLSWSALLATNAEQKASIAAASRITLGLKTDGTVVASGNKTQNQWAVAGEKNIIKISAGLTHTMLLAKDLTVKALGQDFAGETLLGDWRNIKAIAAGKYSSYGLDIDGMVYAAGLNTSGQLAVGDWRNIINIAAGAEHAVGVTASGKVVAVGSNSSGQLNTSAFTIAANASCGNNFTAVLNADGTVGVVGALATPANTAIVSGWHDIIKISAGQNYLVALKSDGTVVTVGDNSYGQSNVSGLIDIVDIAAAEYHTAYLRQDGVVIYKGIGNSAHDTNSPMANLKYDSYVSVTDIAFSIPQITALEGDAFNASAAILPSNATYKRIIFTSSDESIATISSDGRVDCKKAGKVTFMAQANGANVFRTIDLEVRARVALQEIRFADSAKNIAKNGEAHLLVVFTPNNATVTSPITYSSDKPSVVSVTSAGVVRGLALGEATITAVLSQDGREYRATCKVYVASDIVKIEWDTEPTKKEYKYGEAINSGGGKIKITAAGASGYVTESVTNDMLSGYSPRTLGAQTILVTYMDKTLTYSITVKDYTKFIEISAMPTVKFKYGDPFNALGGKLTLHKASDNNEVINIDRTKCSGYNAQKPSIQTITVTYKEDFNTFTATYDIMLEDTVIAIASNLRKLQYNWGEPINLMETIKLKMASGAEREVELSQTVVAGFNSNILGAQIITISYTDPVSRNSYSVDVNINIYLEGKFTIDELNEGESVGDKSAVLYTVGATELTFGVKLFINNKLVVIPKESEKTADEPYYIVTGFQPESVADREYAVLIKIFFRDNDTQIGILYSEQLSRSAVVKAQKPVASAEIVLAKNNIRYGEKLDVKIKLNYEDGTTGEIIPRESDIIYNKELVDVPQMLTVKYMAVVIPQKEITINDYVVKIKPIAKQTIFYGATLALDVFLAYASGREAKAIGATYTYDNKLLDVEQQITVSYTDTIGTYTTIFTLVVADKLRYIDVKSGMKTLYKYGETFDPTSVYVLTYDSGKVEDKLYNDIEFTSSQFSSLLVGQQTVTVTFIPLNKTFTVAIVVRNYCVSIAVNKESKLIYNYNEPLSIAITAIMADGQKKENPTDFTTNYDAKKLGAQRIAITYNLGVGYCDITVNDVVASIAFIKSPGKTDYYYGEAISYVGGAVKVVYESGAIMMYENSGISVLQSSYNPTKEGTQVVKLTAGAKSITFTVKVSRETPTVKTLGDYGGKLKVDEVKKKLIFSDKITIGDLKKQFFLAKYLHLSIKTEAGAEISDNETRYLPSGATVKVLNESEQVIYKYAVAVLGDSDKNGEINAGDLPSIAEEYLGDNADKDVVDYDGDGVFSLTDIVNFARRAQRERAKNANAVAQAFISAVRLKEDGSEEI